MKLRLLALLSLPVMTTGLTSCGDVDWKGLGAGLVEILATDYSGAATSEYQYDENGYPIYGYDGEYPVYGYDADDNPIYTLDGLANAVQVPDWEPTGAAASSSSSEASTYSSYSRRASRRSSAPPAKARHRHRSKDGGLRASSHRKARPGADRRGSGARSEGGRHGRHGRHGADRDDRRGNGPDARQDDRRGKKKHGRKDRDDRRR